jgi:phosphate transport system permease protein
VSAQPDATAAALDAAAPGPARAGASTSAGASTGTSAGPDARGSPTPFAPSEADRRAERQVRAARLATGLAAALLALPVVLVIAVMLVKAWPALEPSLLFEVPRDKGKAGGLLTPLLGTFWLVIVSVAVTTPIGVAAAIYLEEYAEDGPLVRAIGLAMTSLAGVPSIVHALFGLGAFVLFAGLGASLLAAACTLAVMNLPVVVAASREALAAVPRSFREACWNLGASRWQTVRHIVLPNALPGILTGVILAVSRAAGETAPIMFTGAVFFARARHEGLRGLFPYDLDEPFTALAMHLHVISTQVANMPPARPFAAAVVLVLLVVAINAGAIALRVRLRARRRW